MQRSIAFVAVEMGYSTTRIACVEPRRQQVEVPYSKYTSDGAGFAEL